MPNVSAALSSPAKRRRLAALLALLTLLALCGDSAAAQLAPASTGGAAALDRLLQRIAEDRRVLVIGAHPDDEDTETLALMARGYGADAAYLSLSRGEGGQNLIGGELGVGLGLLRSRELAAARAVDGAHQFFTRAYDFGYSRSLGETSKFWLPDSVLKDVLRIVRRFRPHVIVSAWSGTPRDRHGQHQMAGVMAQRVFAIGGDPRFFPALEAEEGLSPWWPLKLYRSTRFDSASTTLVLATGGLEPRVGKSYHQIAMASRSQHRSQDMGMLQTIGPAATRLRLLSDRTATVEAAARDEFFGGIPADTSWLAQLADSLRASVTAARLADAAAPLAAALLQGQRTGVDPGRLRLLNDALAVSAGLVMDARANRSEVVPGATLEVTVDVYNAGPFPVSISSVTLSTPPGWDVQAAEASTPPLAAGARASQHFHVTVAADESPTQPYYLRRPLVGSLYDWADADPAVRGLPFQQPPLSARVEVSLFEATVALTREVTYRYRDQAVGEVRQPIRVVPLVDVKLDPDQVVWSAQGDRVRVFTVTLTANAEGVMEGWVELEIEDWASPPAQRFRFGRAGESRSFSFTVERPVGIERAEVQARAAARADGGAAFDGGVRVVAYPHIRSTPWVQPAVSTVRVAPIAVPALEAVGYVRGASDRMPEALEQIGVPVQLLNAEDLARGDLRRFDAIVVGSRAYETDSALVRHNDRLLAYAQAGGLLVVQYQQYQYIRAGHAPYPLTIARPHDRVTDETAPVRILQPDHPLFTRPNRIGSEDWNGWPQERGLYFANTWDSAYLPVLEMADRSMPPLKGGLLIARYGAGTYVYTGLSFFRALPAGVTGAYRLFLNLLALNKE